MVELYFQSCMSSGVVLNELSPGITLPLPYRSNIPKSLSCIILYLSLTFAATMLHSVKLCLIGLAVLFCCFATAVLLWHQNITHLKIIIKRRKVLWLWMTFTKKINILDKCGGMSVVSLGYECLVIEFNHHTWQGFTAYIFIFSIWENKQAGWWNLEVYNKVHF
jgi:hypothetical protein